MLETYSYFVEISYFTTLIITFIANYKVKQIKRLQDIKSITNIMQIDALFDVLAYIYIDSNSAKTIALIYSIIFPITVMLNGIYPGFKNNLFFFFILLFSLTIGSTIPYTSFNEYKDYYFIPVVLLQLLSILACSYKVIQHKRILQPVNYFYYLLLGFLILDFFWYLGYNRVITRNFQLFMNYHYFFNFYLAAFRIIYIYYVVKYLKPLLIEVK